MNKVVENVGSEYEVAVKNVIYKRYFSAEVRATDVGRKSVLLKGNKRGNYWQELLTRPLVVSEIKGHYEYPAGSVIAAQGSPVRGILIVTYDPISVCFFDHAGQKSSVLKRDEDIEAVLNYLHEYWSASDPNHLRQAKSIASRFAGSHHGTL